jgi:hypothetical protein
MGAGSAAVEQQATAWTTCECGCGEAVNLKHQYAQAMHATGASICGVAHHLNIRYEYAKELVRRPLPRFVKGHSGRANVWEERACASCGNVARRTGESPFCWRGKGPCAAARTVFKVARWAGQSFESAVEEACVAVDRIRKLEEQRELASLIAEQQRDAQSYRVGFWARPSLDEPIRIQAKNVSFGRRGDLVAAAMPDADEWIVQTVAARLRSTASGGLIADAIRRIAQGFDFDETDVALVREEYRRQEARLLRSASIPGTREHWFTDAQYEDADLPTRPEESVAPQVLLPSPHGDGHLKRGRGRGRHKGNSRTRTRSLVGRKRFESKSQIAAEQACRRERVAV